MWFLDEVWPLPMDFFRFSMDFFGFLWIGIQFQVISWWGVAASYGFLLIFDGFLWISVDLHPPPIDFSHRDQRRPSHARDVHHRASRKLHESVLLGCLAISVFFCDSLWLHQIMNDSVWITLIFIDFYWLPADSLQFPMMSCVFNIIISYPMDFLDFLDLCPGPMEVPGFI